MGDDESMMRAADQLSLIAKQLEALTEVMIDINQKLAILVQKS